jgi:hypothetical protein
LHRTFQARPDQAGLAILAGAFSGTAIEADVIPVYF